MPKSAATKPDRLKQAHERLTQAVESITTGDDWARMLKVASKFHKYSFNNQLLIFLQRPEATLVAGFRRWVELNRFVRKGEKGIAILAPCKYKTKIEDEHGEEKTLNAIRGFRVVHVFDVSQTDGEPIEDLEAIRPKLLAGDAPEGIWDALITQANTAGYEVVRAQRGSENGYCDFGSKTIGVRPSVSELQAIKTLVHELAHVLLHADEPMGHRGRQEVEVESTAFVVLAALQLASDDYSFPYVARWSDGEIEVVKSTADKAVSCASRILSAFPVEVAAPST
jgi:antirestriction protein ArdC